MARLQTLYLPDDGGYAFIVDQIALPADAKSREELVAWGALVDDRWRMFATACGAKAIMVTPETIEVVDPFGNVETDEPDDEPGPLTVGDLHEFLRHVAGKIRFVGSEEWTNPDEGGCGTTLNVHALDDCEAQHEPAEGEEPTWCIIHNPMPGPWDGWPRWFDEDRMIMTRMCPHGFKHPTPEEYARGFDGEHECDRCLCSPDTVLSVVTALRGSAPSPDEIKAFIDQHEANRAAEKRLLDAIFPTKNAPPADLNHWSLHPGEVPQPCMPTDTAGAFTDQDEPTAEEISARVAEGIRERGGLGVVIESDLTEREKRIRTLAGIPDREVLPPALADQPANEPKRCGAMNSAGAGCLEPYGHTYLHKFATWNAGVTSGDDTAGA